MCFVFFPYGKPRWKQVRILCGTATVKRECCLLCHWETGKADSMMISEPGDMHETIDCSNGILQAVVLNFSKYGLRVIPWSFFVWLLTKCYTKIRHKSDIMLNEK